MCMFTVVSDADDSTTSTDIVNIRCEDYGKKNQKFFENY